MWISHASELNASVFAPAFLVVALTSAASSWFFWQMPADAGHEVSGRKAAEIASRKGAGKGAEKAAAAWDYIKFLETPQSQRTFAAATGYIDATLLQP